MTSTVGRSVDNEFFDTRPWGPARATPVAAPVMPAAWATVMTNAVTIRRIDSVPNVPRERFNAGLCPGGHQQDCEDLAWEMENYSWKLDKDDNSLDEPAKQDDDACDMASYAITTILIKSKYSFRVRTS
jgi:hypothetical protein